MCTTFRQIVPIWTVAKFLLTVPPEPSNLLARERGEQRRERGERGEEKEEDRGEKKDRGGGGGRARDRQAERGGKERVRE